MSFSSQNNDYHQIREISQYPRPVLGQGHIGVKQISKCKSELILKLKLFANGLKAKHVCQLPLCISHAQLAILIG
jgi:hypothetical protein